MARRWQWCMTLMLVVGLLAGCKKSDADGTDQPSPAIEARPDLRPEPEATKPMLPKKAKDKGPILVGGCKESCEAPKDAFRNFVRALYETGPESLPKYTMFIDSTTLVDNGERLGQRWADMWLMKRFDERQAEVDGWLKDYRKRVGTVTDQQTVEDALASGLQFRRISSVLVEFTFYAPSRQAAGNSDEWRIKMGKRGLEWLVQDIYD